MGDLAQELSGLLRDSVRSLVAGRDVAVAFSGGLDSSIVAALAAESAGHLRLYAVGTENSTDVAAATEAAELIKADFSVIPLCKHTLLDDLKGSMTIAGTDSPLVLAFEIPLYRVMKACVETDVIGGQGADELFLGYAKYKGMDAEALALRRKEDLRRLNEVTLPHEKALAERFGKTALYPYLDDRIKRLVLSAPLEEIDPKGDSTKPLLREVADILGYGDLAKRPKKAAQYGSGAMGLINEICKERGIEYNVLVSGLSMLRPPGID